MSCSFGMIRGANGPLYLYFYQLPSSTKSASLNLFPNSASNLGTLSPTVWWEAQKVSRGSLNIPEATMRASCGVKVVNHVGCIRTSGSSVWERVCHPERSTGLLWGKRSNCDIEVHRRRSMWRLGNFEAIFCTCNCDQGWDRSPGLVFPMKMM